LEHVGALRVLGALSALLGLQHSIGIYLFFKSLEERFSCGARALGAVVCASPRDFCCDAPIDVLGRVPHLLSSLGRALVGSAIRHLS
jgi:hypothetical protein